MTEECKVCASLRPLPKHLYELAEFCDYLGNSVVYTNGKSSRHIRTESIGSWLKLASRLEKVQIDTWNFAGSDGFYCDTVAERNDSDAAHYTDLSTDLTRFIFVSYAIEEAYRFVTENYYIFCEAANISPKKRFREPSMKAAFLIDQYSESDLPKNFSHTIARLKYSYDFYLKEFSPQMSAIGGIDEKTNSYGLYLIRNLRNHIAHGVFPLIENPEYMGYEANVKGFLIELLKQATRVSAVYIQMILVKYNVGFESLDYKDIQRANGKEFEYFLENCTSQYGNALHLSGSFCLEKWYG